MQFIVFLIVMLTAFNGTVYYRFYTPLKEQSVKSEYYDNLIYSKIPYTKIDKEQYNVDYINCGADKFLTCFKNHYINLYDANDRLKMKTIYFFTDSPISFPLVGDWYKNGDNIQEVLSKLTWTLIIPEKKKYFWPYQYIFNKKMIEEQPDRLEEFLEDYINEFY